ncbi:MAG: SAM-dependent chlorinase/fluorinase [Magnetococcales bacterium]|nr:SAM-dependent chlorinase/fluorinase [Magnetococcales bacterium]
MPAPVMATADHGTGEGGRTAVSLPPAALHPPTIVLLTDFGSHDPYVGQVKGTVLRLWPEALHWIDLYHDIPPYRVVSAAWLLDRCLPHIPDQAIWLAVVDPGVGSQRRILGVRWRQHRFIAPDNGLLSAVLQKPDALAFALTPDLHQRAISPTFHGRDLMAPLVVQLLRNQPLSDLGHAITDAVRLPFQGWQVLGPHQWLAEVMLVDHYGNLITGLPSDQLQTDAGSSTIHGRLHGRDCGRLVSTFSDSAPGHAALVVGGFGTVEVVVNQGHAACHLGAAVGDSVIIERKSNIT